MKYANHIEVLARLTVWLGALGLTICFWLFIISLLTGCASIEKIKDSLPVVDDKPEPTTEELSVVKIHKVTIKNKRTITLHMDVRQWRIGHVMKDGVKHPVDGQLHFFRKINGEMVGGKFEWLRPGQTVKTTENILHGYNGHTVPEDGETVYFQAVSLDGEKTNLAEAIWE
jgi:hypothetical protein